MVMVPFGFLSLITRRDISASHSTRQTMCMYAPNRLIHTPPAPMPEASIFPTSDIVWGTNSLTWVGRLRMSRSSIFQSRKALCTAPFFPKATILGWAATVRLNGEQRPLPTGRPMVAWRSFPTNFSKRLNGIAGKRRITFNSVMIASSFLVGSSMHRRAPSKTQPRISLRTSHSPSPSSNFLSDLYALGSGTLSEVRGPVTNGRRGLEIVFCHEL